MDPNAYLRTTFNNVAELYDVIRPKYPAQLFVDLMDAVRLSAEADLLEIGPGTGQATEPLAKRGCSITAIELGIDLANLARQKLQAYSNVHIVTGAFEEAVLPPEAFDLVYSATAFHWIAPEAKFSKPHALLRKNGYLAIIHTHHVSDGADDAFLFASQPIYAKTQPGALNKDFRPPLASQLKPDALDETLFSPIFFRVFSAIARYTADEYVQLLSTYSGTIAMSPHCRRIFLNDMRELIERDFNGRLDKHYAFTLTIGKKK